MTSLTQNKAFVKSVWNDVHATQPTHTAFDGEWVIVIYPIKTFIHNDLAEAWAAAAAYTRDVLEEIGRLEAEIDLVSKTRLEGNEADHSRWTRILTRLHATLTGLQKGMKQD